MRIGVLLIGDELLSGRRRDKHLPKVIELLGARGLEPGWVRIEGDDEENLVRTLQQTLAGEDLVLSFGGIGATPDDRTRQAAARALDVPLVRHPDGVKLLEARFGEQTYPQRIRMVEFPEGASLIPNPFNQVPGFSLRHHYFMPGFPEMAWPMTEWILDVRYPHLRSPAPPVQHLVRVFERAESEMVPLMEQIGAEFPDVRLSSLPHIGNDAPYIEFGLRGPQPDADAARAAFCRALDAQDVPWRAQP